MRAIKWVNIRSIPEANVSLPLSPVVVRREQAHGWHTEIEEPVYIVVLTYNDAVHPRCLLFVLVFLGLFETPNAVILVFALLVRRLKHLLLQGVHHAVFEFVPGHTVHLPVHRVLWLSFEHQLKDLHHVFVLLVLLDDVSRLLDLKCCQLLWVHARDFTDGEQFHVRVLSGPFCEFALPAVSRQWSFRFRSFVIQELNIYLGKSPVGQILIRSILICIQILATRVSLFDTVWILVIKITDGNPLWTIGKVLVGLVNILISPRWLLALSQKLARALWKLILIEGLDVALGVDDALSFNSSLLFRYNGGLHLINWLKITFQVVVLRKIWNLSKRSLVLHPD